MAEKTYFEILQEQAAKAAASSKEQGPELTVGTHRFTIIGGASGVSKNTGKEWASVVVRHTNGHEYRLFYTLYWPLKAGELTPRLNVDCFNWIVGFDQAALASYTEVSFDKYFDGLTGRQFDINYTLSKQGKVVIDYKTLPVESGTMEESIELEEINFDEIE